MNDIFSQLMFGLQVAWYKIRYETGTHVTLVVTALAIILLVWIFFSPAVRKKGS